MHLAPLFVFALFPATPNPTRDTMNWGIVIYGGIIIFATVYYIIWGRKTYTSPKDTFEDLLARDEYYMQTENEAGIKEGVSSDKDL
jgi:hypothetical protein